MPAVLAVVCFPSSGSHCAVLFFSHQSPCVFLRGKTIVLVEDVVVGRSGGRDTDSRSVGSNLTFRGATRRAHLRGAAHGPVGSDTFAAACGECGVGEGCLCVWWGDFFSFGAGAIVFLNFLPRIKYVDVAVGSCGVVSGLPTPSFLWCDHPLLSFCIDTRTRRDFAREIVCIDVAMECVFFCLLIFGC